MAKKITLEIDAESLEKLQKHAEMENLSLPDFVLKAAIRYVEQNELVDEFELAEILEKENLLS